MSDKEGYQAIKFYFETSSGPGHIIVGVPPGADLDKVEEQLLHGLSDMYQEISVTSYEIIQKH